MGSEESKPQPARVQPPQFNVPKTEPAFKEPWRTTVWGNKENEMRTLKSFNLERYNTITHLRVLLYGPAGGGKSSFINSADSICHNRITSPAMANSGGEGTFTIKCRTHKIQKEEFGNHYPFVFTDVMGLEGTSGVRVDDIKLVMKGHVKEGYKFHPQSTLDESNPSYNKNPTSDDTVHVLVCVVPANIHDVIKEKEIYEKMTEVRLAARDLDIPNIAILTKIDEGCPLVKQDIKDIYKSKYIKKAMEKFSVAVGFPMNCIFPVKNYHEEVNMNVDMDILILGALNQMMHLANDSISVKMANCVQQVN